MGRRLPAPGLGTAVGAGGIDPAVHGPRFLGHGAGRQARRRQPSGHGGAALGTLVGLFFGLPGLLLGPFIGALVGELLVLRSLRSEAIGQATKVGAGTWIGLLIGIVLRFALAFAMLGLFAFAWWI